MISLDSQVAVASISTLGGIAIAFITVRYRNVVINKNRLRQPKDRMDTIFNGYESLIKQQQQDIERKSTMIESLQRIVDSQRLEIEKSQDLINTLRTELTISSQRTKDLEHQLTDMKKEYRKEGTHQ